MVPRKTAEISERKNVLPLLISQEQAREALSAVSGEPLGTMKP
jgi:hypothetical protein